MNREEWAEQLVERYADMVMRIGYTWFNNPYDAQDICQNVFFKLIERKEGFDSNQGERAWVLRVTLNECKNLKKSTWFRRTVGLEEGVAMTAELPSAECDGLLTLVQSLPRKFREAVYLYYYEGYQVIEIAALLGRSPALVSTHLARARKKLRGMIEEGKRNE